MATDLTETLKAFGVRAVVILGLPPDKEITEKDIHAKIQELHARTNDADLGASIDLIGLLALEHCAAHGWVTPPQIDPASLDHGLPRPLATDES